MDLTKKDVYVIKIDSSAGIIYLRKQSLKYLINSQAGGMPYARIFTTKQEAENKAKEWKKKFTDLKYKIKKNY